MHGETRVPLSERVAGNEDAIEHVKTDVRTCALLVEDPTRSNAFRFAHKSFMEYLVASVGVGLILKSGQLDGDAGIVRRAELRRVHCLGHAETLEFMAELLVNRMYAASSESGSEVNARAVARVVFGKSILVSKVWLLTGAFIFRHPRWLSRAPFWVLLFTGTTLILYSALVGPLNLFSAYASWRHRLESVLVGALMVLGITLVSVMAATHRLLHPDAWAKFRLFINSCRVIGARDEDIRGVFRARDLKTIVPLLETLRSQNGRSS
jgi:hypothetical protein